jgi:hypothetical protein
VARRRDEIQAVHRDQPTEAHREPFDVKGRGSRGARLLLRRSGVSSLLRPPPARYGKVLVPEINLGQLALLLRGRYLAGVISYNRVRGLPFRAAELADVIKDVIDNA